MDRGNITFNKTSCKCTLVTADFSADSIAERNFYWSLNEEFAGNTSRYTLQTVQKQAQMFSGKPVWDSFIEGQFQTPRIVRRLGRSWPSHTAKERQFSCNGCSWEREVKGGAQSWCKWMSLMAFADWVTEKRPGDRVSRVTAVAKSLKFSILLPRE